jgi:hypothetical protein
VDKLSRGLEWPDLQLDRICAPHGVGIASGGRAICLLRISLMKRERLPW